MSKNNQDPEAFPIENETPKLKFKTAGGLSALIRIAMDIGKGSLGAGTLPEIIKSVEFKSSKEGEAYRLIASALINACERQLQQRIDQIDIDQNERLIYNMKELRFDIFKDLDDNEYEFHCKYSHNPQAFGLLKDFLPYYQTWLKEAFTMSGQTAKAFASDFPDYFANVLLEQLHLHSAKYTNLLAWCKSPELALRVKEMRRQAYKAQLKSRYHRSALGEEAISLSDIYVELDFNVFDRILPETQQSELRDEFSLNQSDDHFLPVKYKGSIHDYFKQEFLVSSKVSKAIGSQLEDSRFLILLGQPGHGKSSFCHRCIYDLLADPEFNGNAFFIRLEDADRKILSDPLTGFKHLLPKAIDFENWIDEEYQQKNVLFLDGLDEFYMTQALEDVEVLRFLDNCQKLLRQNPYLYIIITSRFNYVETNKLFEGERLVLALGELNKEQQLKLIQNYTTRKPNSHCNLNEALIDKIEEEDTYKNVRELIKLPILLQMVLQSEVALDQASSRAAIYQELFEMVLKRKWEKPLQKYKRNEKFTVSEFKAYLSFLAFKIYQNQEGYLRKSQIVGKETRRFIKKYLKVDYEEKGLKTALKDVLTSFYLKERQKNSADQDAIDQSNDFAIEFLHKSLYEYLACEYLWQQTNAFFLKKDQEGEDYEDYDLEDVLKHLQYLFAQVRLTEETMEYLQEIIALDTAPHQILSERIGYYFPKVLKSGLLYEYKYLGKQARFTVEGQSLNVFHGLLTIFGALNLQEIDKEHYFESSWGDFIKEHRSNDWGKQFELYIKELIQIEEEKFLSDEARIKYWQQELIEFKTWLSSTSTETLEATQNSFFENWCRNLEYRKRGQKVRTNQIKALQADVPDFARYLRLIAAQRMPMPINLDFSKLNKADFRGLIAVKIQLEGADLRYADLSNAYLSNADLRYADLRYADLRHADLINADLRYADLRYADLRYADLRYADLSGLRVATKDWITNLKELEVKGASAIAKQYKISAEKTEFIDQYGSAYEAYVLEKRQD